MIILHGRMPVVARACVSALLGSAFAMGFSTPGFSGDSWIFEKARWNAGLTVTPELRIFTSDPAFTQPQNRQDGSTLQPSIAFEPHFQYSAPGGDDFFVFKGFARYDPEDSERSVGDLREAYWLHEGGNWDLVTGVNQVFWGVVESNNIVDIINQKDLAQDILGDEKLGQPMINANLMNDWGEFSLFALPLFRPRTHADEDGRLRGFFPIDDHRNSFDGSNDEWRVDFAGRYENSFGPVDVGLSHFYGLSREPISRVVFNTGVPGLGATVNGMLATPAGQAALVAACTPICTAPLTSGQFVIAQHYDRINQSGIDLSAVLGQWQFKFEGVIINGHADNTVLAGVAGVEYTFFDAIGTDGELGLLAELSLDDRDQGRAPQIDNEHDIFVGTRFDLNDADNLQIRSGVSVDLKTAETAITFEGSRRIFENVTGEVEGQFFLNSEPGGLIDSIRRDDNLTVRFSYYF